MNGKRARAQRAARQIGRAADEHALQAFVPTRFAPHGNGTQDDTDGWDWYVWEHCQALATTWPTISRALPGMRPCDVDANMIGIHALALFGIAAEERTVEARIERPGAIQTLRIAGKPDPALSPIDQRRCVYIPGQRIFCDLAFADLGAKAGGERSPLVVALPNGHECNTFFAVPVPGASGTVVRYHPIGTTSAPTVQDHASASHGARIAARTIQDHLERRSEPAVAAATDPAYPWDTGPDR